MSRRSGKSSSKNSPKVIDEFLNNEEEDNNDYVRIIHNQNSTQSSTKPSKVSSNVDSETSNEISNETVTNSNSVSETVTNTNSDHSQTSNVPTSTPESTSSNSSSTSSSTSTNSTTNSQVPNSTSNSTPNRNSGSISHPEISVEISDKPSSNSADLSDESLNKTIETAKQSFIDSLSADVSKLEETNSVHITDPEKYFRGTTEFGAFIHYLVGACFVPSSITTTLSMNEFINSVTTFKYDSYDSPNMSIVHPLSETVIYLKRLSSIFGEEFLSSVAQNWKFDSLDDKIATFLSRFNHIPSIKLEYELIRSFMGKVIISLSTTTDLAFRESQTPLVTAQYRSVIEYDIAVMNKLMNKNSKLSQSWEKFMDAFYGTSADNFVYVHENYTKLNEKLATAYKNDYLTEILLANALKCYFPSISLNYFYVIKCVYLIVRMIGVYVHLQIDRGISKSLTEIMNDLNVIAAVGTIVYENKNYLFKQTQHSLPRGPDNVSEKTNMYILNHLFTGGQYYLLKMFERSVPALSDMVSTYIKIMNNNLNVRK